MNDLKKYLEKHYPADVNDLVVFDGFDDAFIGVGCSYNKLFVCYSKRKIIDILLNDGSDMTPEEADEYFEFNIAGADFGENTPVIMEDC